MTASPPPSPAAVREEVDATVERLAGDRVASRIAAQDPEVWGPEARSEAAVRLGWTRLHETSRPLVAQLEALRGELAAEGVDRVVLCGMGGSSLAPEVICAAAGVDLVVLDSTDPSQVRAALTDAARTVVVVSSKSGSTLETDSQRRSFVELFSREGVDAASRLVVVTDPGSALETTAREGGYRAVFLADPHVGGRYSALSAFGLVPSALAGADVAGLLDEAASVAGALAADDPANPALRLGAALAATPRRGGAGVRDKVVIVASGAETGADGSPDGDGGDLPGFGDWAEQLIAESTGKLGRGVLPVVAGPVAPEVRAGAPDVLVAHVSGGASGVRVEGPDDVEGVVAVGVDGPLGAQFLLWEHATAVAGVLLGINPFDQPDVESAKQAARGLLDATPDPVEPAFSDSGVDVTASPGALQGASTLPGAVAAVLSQVPADGYVAVMAYLDRLAHAPLAEVRDALATRTARPVTFGWGPRFLHSTGQFHKGGPAVGVFVQVVAGEGWTEDLPIPDRPFTFGRLIAAQAAGDAVVLASHDRPVLTFTVHDRAGLDAVRAALEGAS